MPPENIAIRAEPAERLWRFAVALYARPGVEPACLRLQDEAGLNVNLLLACIWRGREHGEAPGADALAAALAAIEPWHETVVDPLRAIRRSIKQQAQHDPAVATVRRTVLEAELAAERVEQGLIVRAFESGPPPAMPQSAGLDAALLALTGYLQVARRRRLSPAATDALTALLSAAFPETPATAIRAQLGASVSGPE